MFIRKSQYLNPFFVIDNLLRFHLKINISQHIFLEFKMRTYAGIHTRVGRITFFSFTKCIPLHFFYSALIFIIHGRSKSIIIFFLIDLAITTESSNKVFYFADNLLTVSNLDKKNFHDAVHDAFCGSNSQSTFSLDFQRGSLRSSVCSKPGLSASFWDRADSFICTREKHF